MIARCVTLSILVLSTLWMGNSPAAAISQKAVEPQAISQNTIAPQAILSTSGRQILVTVQLACRENEMVQVRATLNQRSTGAVAEGQTYGHCTGAVIHIPLVLTSFGPASFAAGEANGCALGMTFTRVGVTDAHQWCRADPITLEAGDWPHLSMGRPRMPSPGSGWRGRQHRP